MAKLTPPAVGSEDDFKKREDLITQQFAANRRRLLGQQNETQRQASQSLARRQAIVGQTGGSIEREKQRAIRDIGQSFADVEAGVTAQESQAKQALGAEKLQHQQFEKALGFQYAELDENKKTNLINAVIAVNNAGLRNVDTHTWLNALYPNANLPIRRPLKVPTGPNVSNDKQQFVNTFNQFYGAGTPYANPRGNVDK